MEIKALVGIAHHEETFPITFESEPKPGDILQLTVEGETSDYTIVDVDPTGFENSTPYLYRVYVKPKQ